MFIAYPSSPEGIGQTIEEMVKAANTSKHNEIFSWRNLDIPGSFIIESILEKIDEVNTVVADISRLNFNVTFEVGYAMGRQKHVVLVMNEAMSPQKKEISHLGIFDTIGYLTYTNSSQLRTLLRKTYESTLPLHEIDKLAPLFVLDTLHKTDSSIRILSKIKKARIGYRSFDPSEQPRLSALEAYRSVAKSIGVVINLLSPGSTDAFENNLRGAFLAGLSYGLGRETLILQEGDEPVPLDYRDFISPYRQLDKIDQYINELAPRVMEKVTEYSGALRIKNKGQLSDLDLGSPAAENETSTLQDYFLKTDEFQRVLNGGFRLAVGRKGSGKTAVFFQVRDRLRRDKRRIVLDLKPEGHQLKRFKELVLTVLSDAIQEHVATAFWEYVLLLEITHKLLEKDHQTHVHDHHMLEGYRRLQSIYGQDKSLGEADFSERMLVLINRINKEFESTYPGEAPRYLTIEQVTGLLYKHEIRELLSALSHYLGSKNGVIILFDNIDKGWPTRGVQPADIMILRGLIEATRKIERSFERDEIECRSTVFIRNDVYELLVNESPDRGKESRVPLDWTNSALLREFLRLRFVYNGIEETLSFEEIWRSFCVSHVRGEESSEYIIERSLMRPRNLLTIVNYCRSNAVNLRHTKMQEDDVLRACEMYSADLGNEVGLEIRDVFPEAEDILYYFIGCPAQLSLRSIYERLAETDISDNLWSRLIEILLWFAFLGVSGAEGEVKDQYIYDVFYDMKKLRRIASGFKDESFIFCVHPAFWPFLGISAR